MILWSLFLNFSRYIIYLLGSLAFIWNQWKNMQKKKKSKGCLIAWLSPNPLSQFCRSLHYQALWLLVLCEFTKLKRLLLSIASLQLKTSEWASLWLSGGRGKFVCHDIQPCWGRREQQDALGTQNSLQQLCKLEGDSLLPGFLNHPRVLLPWTEIWEKQPKHSPADASSAPRESWPKLHTWNLSTLVDLSHWLLATGLGLQITFLHAWGHQWLTSCWAWAHIVGTFYSLRHEILMKFVFLVIWRGA